MTTRAAQIECLLTPVIDYRTTSVASGYTVYFYDAGTTTPKNVWTEKEKTNPYTSRTLGSDGTVAVYGDGVYKIVIQDATPTTIYTWDNIKVQANTYTTQTKTDTYTATADDDLVLCNGTFTVNLATVTGFTHPITIKRIGGTITIDPYSTQTIDGSSTITLTSEDDVATLHPDIDSTTWRRANRLSGLTATTTELNTLDGITATVAELNILDGVTATYDEINTACDGITATSTEINEMCDGAGVSIPRMKVLEIGDWNMNTTASVNVAHGLTIGDIIDARACIRDDGDSFRYPFPNEYNASQSDLELWAAVNSTSVVVNRLASGYFAGSSSFDSTSYNRGWVIVYYLD